MWGEVIGGGLSLFGGERTNASNARTAAAQMAFQGQQNQIAREFEAGESALNRNFQSHMSATAHQREVADFRAAGLNPILSATGGPGASTPSGAKGSASGAPGASYHAVDSVGNAVSSALAARRNVAEVKNIEADERLKDAQRGRENLQGNLLTTQYQLVGDQRRTEQAEARRIELENTGRRVESDIDKTPYGRGLRYADRVGKTIGSALGARRLFQQP